jgi:hypothetical protein
MPFLSRHIYASLNLPLDKLDSNYILNSIKTMFYISERKTEVNYQTCKIFRSFWRISLPSFPFEFSVEEASNRMIDNRSNKGFKAFNFYLFIVLLKNVNDDKI